jgi:hypothetical protein
MFVYLAWLGQTEGKYSEVVNKKNDKSDLVTKEILMDNTASDTTWSVLNVCMLAPHIDHLLF